MNFPTKKLKNPYYFIKDNVVYEISNNQDADNCGQHLVTFKTTSLDGNDRVFVKEGEKYLDLHGTPTIANRSGYYRVSTGQIDVDANKLVFPWICIEYKVNKDDAETTQEYLWLDYLIEDGDTFDGTKFVMNEDHAPENGSYVAFYKESILKQIGLYYANGYSDNDIERSFPDYLFAEQYGEDIPSNSKPNVTIDNKKVYLVGITTSENVSLTVTEEEMLSAFYEYCNTQVIAYANRLLKRQDKKLRSTIVVSEETVEPIHNTTCSLVISPYSRYCDVIVTGADNLEEIPYDTLITVNARVNTQTHVILTPKMTANGTEVDIPYTFNIHEDTVIDVKLYKPNGDIAPDNLEPIDDDPSIQPMG